MAGGAARGRHSPAAWRWPLGAGGGVNWGPTLWGMASPIDHKAEMVFSSKPPNTSATMGMKSMKFEKIHGMKFAQSIESVNVERLFPDKNIFLQLSASSLDWAAPVLY